MSPLPPHSEHLKYFFKTRICYVRKVFCTLSGPKSGNNYGLGAQKILNLYYECKRKLILWYHGLYKKNEYMNSRFK